MTIDQIRVALQEAKLDRLADDVERLTLPAISIVAQEAEEADIPVGASKFGGRPDLPPDVSWPERNGAPLGFLAQLNLADLAPLDAGRDLPPSGLLSFFYDFAAAPWGIHPEDRGGWQVLYFDGDAQMLLRAKWPATLPALQRLPSQQPIYFSTTTLTQEPERIEGLRLTCEELERYYAVTEALTDQADMRHIEDKDDDTDMVDEEDDDEDEEDFGNLSHQILGHPAIVHYGNMPWMCEMCASGRPDPHSSRSRIVPVENWSDEDKAVLTQAYQKWRLLLQLGNISGRPAPLGGEDDDDEVWVLSDLCDLWARGGLMYFWIEKDRLAQRDFSNVWLLGASEV